MSGAFRSGFVSVVGRPNVGKSTLVNRLVGRKVAIVSPRPQTTRNRLLGIANLAEAQVVLMDTPGLHKPTSALGRQMMEEVDQALEGADLVALLVDSSEEFGSGDRWALERVHDFGGPTFLVLNKIDLIPKPRLLPLIDTYRLQAEFVEIVPISALTIAESQPLVRVAFAHTRMHEADMAATGIALAIFSIGMFGWGAQYILARGFYATRDTITPAVVGTIMTALNIPLYWLLVRRSQYRGLATASTIGIIVYTIVLFVLLVRRTQNRESRALVALFAKVSAASLGSALGAYLLGRWMEGFLPWQRAYAALAVLVIVTAAGVLLLGILLRLLRVTELENYLKRTLSLVTRRFGRVRGNAAGA